MKLFPSNAPKSAPSKMNPYKLLISDFKVLVNKPEIHEISITIVDDKGKPVLMKTIKTHEYHK